MLLLLRQGLFILWSDLSILNLFANTIGGDHNWSVSVRSLNFLILQGKWILVERDLGGDAE